VLEQADPPPDAVVPVGLALLEQERHALARPFHAGRADHLRARRTLLQHRPQLTAQRRPCASRGVHASASTSAIPAAAQRQSVVSIVIELLLSPYLGRRRAPTLTAATKERAVTAWGGKPAGRRLNAQSQDPGS
jgi:hypothetical protein